MIKTTNIPLIADTLFIFPDDFTGKNKLTGDDSITESEIQRYSDTSLSFLTAGTVEIEFDYGLGFNEKFSQIKRNQDYNSKGVIRIRLKSIGQANTAILQRTRPLGGL